MIHDKIILDLPGNALIQHHMDGEKVQQIKIYRSPLGSPLKLEVISKKGEKIITDLYGKEWDKLTFPEFVSSHYFIIKKTEESYCLSLQDRKSVV